MTLPEVVSPEAWVEAHKALSEKEKATVRTRDALYAERRRLPMVRVEKDYIFEGPDGKSSLADLFGGRRQLIVYHFWFEPGEAPCQGCSLWVSDLGSLTNLHGRDTSLALVSRASPAEIGAFKESVDWTVPWFSLVGDDFNTDAGYAGEAQITVFLRDAEMAFRTYATSGRSLEAIGNHWTLLDLTPFGRQEEPAGREPGRRNQPRSRR